MRGICGKNRSSVSGVIIWAALMLAVAGQFLIGCDSSASGPEADPDAQIIITSPVGGETFYIGDSLRVKWTLQGKGFEEVNSVNILISPDSGKTWVGMITKSLGSEGDDRWGDFGWYIPQTLLNLGVAYELKDNSKLLIKVMQYTPANVNQIAVTKKPFTIKAK
jgi:hypothetical protein